MPFLAVGLAFRAEKFAILEIETLYFLATNVERRLQATLTGAVVARGCCGLSYFLGLFRFATSETSTRFKERWKRRSVTESTRPLE